MRRELRVKTGRFTLSIPSARQHRDSFAGSRQVLEKYLLAVWLRHFPHGVSVRVHLGRKTHRELCSKMNEGQRPFVLSCHRASAALSFSPVPQLFVDLHRLTLRGVTDVGRS